jgi:N-acetylneuraminate lyase
MSAPTLPLFLYHIPAFTHVDFNVEDVLREARSIVPNLCGVKYSDYNLYSFSQCLQLDAGRYQCLYGVDQQLLPALTLGAKAAIGSTYNYNGKLNNKLIAAFERGDLTTAQKEQVITSESFD